MATEELPDTTTADAVMVDPSRMKGWLVVWLVTGQIGFGLTFVLDPELYHSIGTMIEIGIFTTNVAALYMVVLQYQKLYGKFLEMQQYPILAEFLSWIQSNDRKLRVLISTVKPIMDEVTIDDIHALGDYISMIPGLAKRNGDEDNDQAEWLSNEEELEQFLDEI